MSTCQQEAYNDFLKNLERLLDESERRFENTTSKDDIDYMITRFKSSLNSIAHLRVAKLSKLEGTDVIDSDQLDGIATTFKTLYGCWESKYVECDHREPSYDMIHAKVVHTGKVGRLRYEVDIEIVVNLLEMSFTLVKIAAMLKIERTTLWRRLKEYGYSDSGRYSKLTSDSLDAILLDFKKTRPECGERSVVGFLRSKGVHVPRAAV